MSLEEFNIQPALLTDAGTIAQFNIDLAFESERLKIDYNTVVEGVKTVINNPEHGFYLVARYQNTVIATLLVTYEWSDWRNGRMWWIQSVFVDNDWRDLGVFSLLYEHITLMACQTKDVRGFRLYVDDSNVNAKKVYKKRGMHETNYRLYESII